MATAEEYDAKYFKDHSVAALKQIADLEQNAELAKAAKWELLRRGFDLYGMG